MAESCDGDPSAYASRIYLGATGVTINRMLGSNAGSNRRMGLLTMLVAEASTCGLADQVSSQVAQ